MIYPEDKRAEAAKVIWKDWEEWELSYGGYWYSVGIFLLALTLIILGIVFDNQRLILISVTPGGFIFLPSLIQYSINRHREDYNVKVRMINDRHDKEREHFFRTGEVKWIK